jgi:Thrombospondin type 3 repeat
MNWLLRTVVVTAGAATLLVAPANAAATPCVQVFADEASNGQPHWFEGDAGDAIPSDVDLEDVAVAGQTVIAVGSRTDSTGTTTAVVFRRTTGDWHEDAIEPAPAAGTALKQVALTTGGVAWAIGTRDGGTAALVLRLDGSVWKPPAEAFPAGRRATAIAAYGDSGYVGDDQGNLYRFLDGNGGTFGDPFDASSAGQINAISMHDVAAGFAGADWAPLDPKVQEDPTLRLYKLSTGVAVPEVVQPQSEPQLNVDALAASSADNAVTIDSAGRIWHVADRVWVREDSVGIDPGSDLEEVAAHLTSGTTLTEAIAGSTDAGGTVWTRRRASGSTAAWECAALGATPLTSVAVSDGQNMWAVGKAGVVRHYWPKPTPDADSDTIPDSSDNCVTVANGDQSNNDADAEGDLCDADDDNDGLADEADNCPTVANGDQADIDSDGIGNACDPHDDTPPPPDTGGGDPVPENPPPPPTEEPQPPPTSTTTTTTTNPPDTTVDQPEPEPEPRRRTTRPRRLLTHLRVERRGRRALVVKFRLSRRARVAVTATRNGRVVGKTGFHRLRKGQRKLIVRFRGKPPSNLKVVVRPLRKRRNS